MSFPADPNVARYAPLAELTDKQLEFKRAVIWHNPSEEEVYLARKAKHEAEEKARTEFQLKRHQHFLKEAGAANSAMTVGQAKKYARGRAASLLKQAFEVMEQVLLSPEAKLADRLDIASEMMKRAVGPHSVPNTIGSAAEAKALTELAPTDAIDTVMKAYANGECDKDFVTTLLGLLGAKVNGLKLEQAGAKRSAEKAGEGIVRPPSGKIV
ncbi:MULTISPECIES: hypothetical protein [unclassified Mesorhizobium]|uniref:hypothetical protein n=1 Tax=unclassified Mesorhizobium TaxID=325217 RepID=UPI000FCB6204|nr:MULTISPECIES: hypothetical protein [unclassified Mesorhizobium]RUX97433.1 hypothetical protein EN993_03790 [Mesorhizobium sp. M7D.F.Ca.US.004.01.2.1]RVA36619.1 hypothetical protein EN935_01600 [Mesorhizobium sp. M7D.F.Ca.US.004.03.1.1]